MRLLLDTHTLLWWWTESRRLSWRAEDLLADNTSEAFVSAATVWEIAIKHKSGKLPTAGGILDRFEALLTDFGLQPLAIGHAHARRAGALPTHHADPFDRVMVAQAEIEALALVSADRIFDRYDIDRIW